MLNCYVAGSNLPQYPAAGPFTQLIYKNINVPVYTTLKGVSEKLNLPLSRKMHSSVCLSWRDVSRCFNQPFLLSPVCHRKPLRSAVSLYLTTTPGQRTTAALWPVYGPPSWARTGRAACQGAHEPSREVTQLEPWNHGLEVVNCSSMRNERSLRSSWFCFFSDLSRKYSIHWWT